MVACRALIIGLALVVAACGGGGGGGSAGSPAGPTVTLDAAPLSVIAGNAATLTWSSTDTTDCAATGDWSGSKVVTGSESTGVLASTASYTLTCNGAGGSTSDTVAVDVTVVPTPVVTLTAAPQTVVSGQSAALSWSSVDATACSASGSWSGSRNLSGTESTGALTGNVSYTLTCSGPGGSASQTAAVTVNPLPGTPTVSLVANPSNVIAGSASTLTWSSSNATACTASGGWTGSRSTSGTQATGSLGASTSYTLTCSGAGGSASQTTTITVTLPAPTVSLSANPTSVASGNSSTLTWSTSNATACTASNGWSGARATNGTASTGSLGASTSYTLSCNGAGGSASQTTTVTVTPPMPTVNLGANPTSVTSGSSSTLTWSTSNATACTASNGWSGAKATSGTASTGALAATTTYVLTCSGTGGSSSQTTTVTVTPAPTVSLSANPTSVTSGSSSALTWSTSNATACTASNGWSGAKATSGTSSTGALTATTTYVLTCTGPGGSANDAATVTVTGSAVQGLDFPGSAAVATTMRFRFFNPLAIFPATYIWRAYPRQQNGYYTAFFWGNDDGLEDLRTFLWVGPSEADSYYGAHPYPDGGSAASTHKWEISVLQADYVNGVVVYDRWYTQALRVWADASGNKHHEFYWDLPNTDAAHLVSRTTNPDWGNRTPPVPALTWGDAPWAPGREVWNGILRGIQVYSTNLSVADIQTEANAPLSTTSGASNVWYLNVNPTPTDISDKSGAGHNPEWVGTERPTLWTGP